MTTVADDDRESLKIRQIIADIDQKRADAALKLVQIPLENRRYLLQLAATIAGAFAAGGSVVALVLRH